MKYEFTFQEILTIQGALHLYARERKDIPGGYADEARRLLEKIEEQRYPALAKVVKTG